MSLGKFTKYRLKVGETFVEVADVIAMTPVMPTRETEDVTPFGGDEDNDWREHEGGLREPGEQELTIRYLDAANPGLDALISAFNTNTKVEQQLCYPLTAKPGHQYKAVVVSVSTEIPIEKKLQRKIKLKLSGKIEDITWV